MDQEQPQQPLPPQQDFDIWEFVTCAKCNLNFSPDGVSGPTVPFWVTECGHVLCNSHLNADQSCPSCNAQGIELMPLQKEMPPPFSDWFCSLPFKLDGLAQAAKFQYERTAGAARYYKARCEQYRSMLVRLKPEIAQLQALKKENERLKSENAGLRGSWSDPGQQPVQQNDADYQQEPASYVNANGKRRLVDSGLGMSSPRSIHTPIGPPRITLPPDHDPPPSLARLGMSNGPNGGNPQRQQPSSSRDMQPPGSGHFTQQYAYNPPQSSQVRLPAQQVFSHDQQAPIRQQQNERRLMPPPPTPVQNRQINGGRQVQRVMTPRVPAQAQPNQIQRFNQGGGQQSYNQSTGTGRFQPLGQAPRRFVPPTTSSSSTNGAPSNPQRFVPSTPSGAHRRFAPQTPIVGDGRRFVPPASSGSGVVQGRNFGNRNASGQTQTQRTAFAPPR